MTDSSNPLNDLPDDETNEATPDLEPVTGLHISPEQETVNLYGDVQVSDKSAALQEELNKTRDQLLRALAETENVRRRGIKEREDATKFAVTGFARDLLDFSDNVRRALDAIPADLKTEGDERIKSLITGLEAMEQQMLRAFEKHGIKKLQPHNEMFDPNFHEVIFEAPGTGKPAGMVIQVAEPGYILNGRLLRPARVGVAKNEGQAGPRLDTQA